MINDIQIQTSFDLQIFSRGFLTLQFILTITHRHETQVGFSQNLVEIRHLNVRFQFDFQFLTHAAARRIRKRPHPFVFFLQCLHLVLLILYIFVRLTVCICRMILFVVFLFQLLFLFCQLRYFFLQLCFGRKCPICLLIFFQRADRL